MRATSGKDPKWSGRYRTYTVRGRGRERMVTLGRVREMTQAQAEEKLCDVIRAERLQSEHLMGIGPIDSLPDTAKLQRQEKLRSATDAGAFAELMVCADLLRKHFEVFKAVSAGASCDLIVMKNGAMTRIEVKCGRVNLDGRVTINLNRNIGKFDVLAIVDRRGTINYQMHTLLESRTSPRVVDAETEQSLRRYCGNGCEDDSANGSQAKAAV